MRNAELKRLCVDVIKNPTLVQQYSKGQDVDQKIREQFFQLLGTETPTKKDIRRQGAEIFEIIEEVLTETYLNGVNEDEFFMQFAETRNLALGDKNEFYIEDNGVLVVSEHSGNHWNISRQKLEGGQSFSVKTKAFAVAVYGDFFLFLTGRLSFGRLVQKVAEAIQNKIYSEVAASFAVASNQLPAQFKKSGSYSEDTLIDLYSHVEAANTGVPIVVGTRKALAKVTAGANVDIFSDSMKNELGRTGRIGEYNGMTFVQLPTVHKANTFEFAYDDDQLLVLAGNTKPVKLTFEGEDYIKEVTDNTTNQDMSFEYNFITRFGASVIFDGLFGIYKLV